jgi:predicted permease
MHWLEGFVQDVRYGTRSFTRSPLLAIAVILTLGLGIGLSTAVLTVINGFFFRARVDKDPNTFVQFEALYSGQVERAQGMLFSTSLEDFRAYQEHTRSLANLAAWSNVSVTIGENGDQIMPLLVTCNFFSLYGLEHAKVGRLFLADECATPGAAPVVVISEEMWRRRFLADAHVIGRAINLNRHPFTVVGVTPARFSGQLKSGMWIPWTMQGAFHGRDLFRQSSVPWLVVEGRIRPGYSKSAAQAEMGIIASQQDRLHPGRITDLRLTNGSFSQYPPVRSQMVWIILLWMGAVTVVLLMACANVTTLLLSRAAARREEIAIRLSLGAGRTRLLRMLLTECLLLAAVAGAISAYLAYRVPDIFANMLPDVNYPVQPDLAVFAYLTGVTLLAGCMAGSAPALESLKIDLATAMKGRMSGAGTKESGLLSALVSAQVAMSVMLLAVTGLVLHARYGIGSIDPGFETKQVILVPLNVRMPPYTEDAAQSFYGSLEQRVRALPYVQSVSFATAPPFSGDDESPDTSEDLRLPDQSQRAWQKASVNFVTADFFETLRIPILRGRTFQQAGLTPQSAASFTIVSEAFARKFWPNADPIGKVVEWSKGGKLVVIAVARDTRSESFGGVDSPKFYILQTGGSLRGSLLFRFQGEPTSVQRGFSSMIGGMDRAAIGAPRTLSSIIDDMASRFGIVAKVVLLLGSLTVFLAVVGIYGVVAFATARRMRELGIRMALGATRGDIVRFVLASRMKPVLAGLAVGVLLAAGGSQVLAQVLGGALPLNIFDPITYASVLVLLMFAALAAMLRPAVRAVAGEPMRTLRGD